MRIKLSMSNFEQLEDEIYELIEASNELLNSSDTDLEEVTRRSKDIKSAIEELAQEHDNITSSFEELNKLDQNKQGRLTRIKRREEAQEKLQEKIKEMKNEKGN